MSSFLYASVLAHDCLEQALGFVVANRLQNPTLLATQLMDIFSDVMMRDRDIQRAVRLDVQVNFKSVLEEIMLPLSVLSDGNSLLLFLTCGRLLFPQAFKDRDPACLSYCSALLYMKVFCSCAAVSYL